MADQSSVCVVCFSAPLDDDGERATGCVHAAPIWHAGHATYITCLIQEGGRESVSSCVNEIPLISIFHFASEKEKYRARLKSRH